MLVANKSFLIKKVATQINTNFKSYAYYFYFIGWGSQYA